MIHSLRKQLGRWRTGTIVGLFAFVIGQTISLAHMADASLHADGAPCEICQAIGHAAAPPTPAAAPVATIQLSVTTACIDFIAAVLRSTFSSHAARAPPTSL